MKFRAFTLIQLLVVIAIIASPAHADTITLKPRSINTIATQRHATPRIVPGVFVCSQPFFDWDGSWLLRFYQLYMEFDLSSLPTRAKVKKATLTLEGIGGDLNVELFAYVGDGTVTISDLKIPKTFISANAHAGQGLWRSDAKQFVSETTKKGERYVGFFAFPSGLNGDAIFSSSPTLTITYLRP